MASWKNVCQEYVIPNIYSLNLTNIQPEKRKNMILNISQTCRQNISEESNKKQRNIKHKLPDFSHKMLTITFSTNSLRTLTKRKDEQNGFLKRINQLHTAQKLTSNSYPQGESEKWKMIHHGKSESKGSRSGHANIRYSKAQRKEHLHKQNIT